MSMQHGELDDILAPAGETIGETVADALYRRLLDLILFGDLVDGGRLLLQELATRFDVSLTPVREALQRLAAEGFITATPRRGYRVQAPNSAHVNDLWQVRLGLEGAAGEQIVFRLNAGELCDRDLAVLTNILDKMDAEAETMSHRRHITLNARFHNQLVAHSGNRLLITLYRSVQVQLLGAWVQRGLPDWRSRLAQEAAEHRAILAALQARDATAVEEAMRRHIRRSLTDAMKDVGKRKVSEGTTKISTGRTQ
jgi:DNA-binding GntR family transcriptional regulator